MSTFRSHTPFNSLWEDKRFATADEAKEAAMDYLRAHSA